MDARTLSKVTGVQAGTINAWIQRGYVPGMDVVVSGRRRDFDLKAAIHVGIMAELMPFGFGAPLASLVAKYAIAGGTPCCLVTHPIQIEEAPKLGQMSGWIPMGGFTPTHFASEKDLPKALAELRGRSPSGLLPSVYIVVNVERIEARMRRAEKESRQPRTSHPKRKS